jgi:serine/threonine protein kinase
LDLNKEIRKKMNIVILSKKDRYTPIKILGQGGYSTVYLGIDHKTGSSVAMKVEDDSSGKNEYQMLKRMGWLWPDCMDHVVCMRDTVEMSELPFLQVTNPGLSIRELQNMSHRDTVTVFIMEDLSRDYIPLNKIPGGSLPDDEIYKLGKELYALTIAFHTLGLVHGDLFPRNVMYNPKTKDFKVIDYGNGCFIPFPNEDSAENERMILDYHENIYCSPDAIFEKFEGDYVSIGAILVYLLSGRVLLDQPYDRLKPDAKRVFTGHKKLQQLIEHLFQYQRPSVTDLEE